jgi:catechol 2,3-dioxygenase-like lactoylglutathione lyase family enzyme
LFEAEAAMATQSEVPQISSSTAPVRGLVPMIHVADVERSVQFYRLLGFEVGNQVGPPACLQWAWLYSPKASEWRQGPNLMLARSSNGAIKADEQAVLFYLYATNLVALRNHLLANGVKASEISYPEYLRAGECRIEDPDGYCLMLAQAGPDTP